MCGWKHRWRSFHAWRVFILFSQMRLHPSGAGRGRVIRFLLQKSSSSDCRAKGGSTAGQGVPVAGFWPVGLVVFSHKLLAFICFVSLIPPSTLGLCTDRNHIWEKTHMLLSAVRSMFLWGSTIFFACFRFSFADLIFFFF